MTDPHPLIGKTEADAVRLVCTCNKGTLVVRDRTNCWLRSHNWAGDFRLSLIHI